MSTYQPQEGLFEGRPPCASCGSPLRLHSVPPDAVAYTTPVPGGRMYLTTRGLAALLEHGVELECPKRYRPGSLVDALGELVLAQRSGDQGRVFAARGEVQRLMDHRPAGEGHCTACTGLASTAS